MLNPSPLLRHTLVADAVISGATGLLMLLGASLLESLLGVPAALLRYAGVSLLPFAVLLLFLATRPGLPRKAVVAVIAANLAWVVASVLLLVSGEIAPTTIGVGFVVFQAVAVAAFADLQYVGLRRSAAAQA
jgi:hypothetical protein